MSDKYYNPPKEWQFNFIVQIYSNLSSNKVPPEVDFDHFEKFDGMVKVKRLLTFISERVKTNDRAAIAVSVNFVVSPVYFHYSGFIRESMARRLKNVELSGFQVKQIINGVERLIESGKTGKEFKEIVKLYTCIKTI